MAQTFEFPIDVFEISNFILGMAKRFGHWGLHMSEKCLYSQKDLGIWKNWLGIQKFWTLGRQNLLVTKLFVKKRSY